MKKEKILKRELHCSSFEVGKVSFLLMIDIMIAVDNNNMIIQYIRKTSLQTTIIKNLHYRARRGKFLEG